MALAAQQADDLDQALDDAADRLIQARPTAVNLSWGVEQIRRARAEGADRAGLLAAALAVRDADITTSRALSERGAQLLSGASRLLTHCNAGALAGVESGSALGVIGCLHDAKPLELVYVPETRPLLQGSRLTAWELGQRGIPHRVLVDSAAAGLIRRGEVAAVVTGFDRVAANGDVANKVGTYGLALAARAARIPFVAAGPSSSVDLRLASGDAIEIEERGAEEVLSVGGSLVSVEGTRVRNPAFDVTPAELVWALVTERGVAQPVTVETIAAVA